MFLLVVHDIYLVCIVLTLNSSEVEDIVFFVSNKKNTDYNIICKVIGLSTRNFKYYEGLGKKSKTKYIAKANVIRKGRI